VGLKRAHPEPDSEHEGLVKATLSLVEIGSAGGDFAEELKRPALMDVVLDRAGTVERVLCRAGSTFDLAAEEEDLRRLDAAHEGCAVSTIGQPERVVRSPGQGVRLREHQDRYGQRGEVVAVAGNVEATFEQVDRPGVVTSAQVCPPEGHSHVAQAVRLTKLLGELQPGPTVRDALGEVALLAQTPGQRRSRDDGWIADHAEALARALAVEQLHVSTEELSGRRIIAMANVDAGQVCAGHGQERDVLQRRGQGQSALTGFDPLFEVVD